jgi:hypothetical protein
MPEEPDKFFATAVSFRPQIRTIDVGARFYRFSGRLSSKASTHEDAYLVEHEGAAYPSAEVS